MKNRDDGLVVLEHDLREALSNLRLPTAPIGLQRRVESMSTGERTNASPRSAWRRSEWTTAAPSRRVAAIALSAVFVLAIAAVGLPLALSPHTGMGPASSVGESGLVASPDSSSSPSSLPTSTPQVLFSAADGSSILADGPSVSWQKVAMTQFGQEGAEILGAARLGDKVVLALNVNMGKPETGQVQVPTFFESTDGSTWAPIPFSGDPFANVALETVIGTSNGLLAIGVYLPPDEPCSSYAPDIPVWCLGQGGYDPWVVLTSSDGRTWQRLPSDPFVPHINGLPGLSATYGPKGALAWGYSTSGFSAGSPAVFRSYHSDDTVNWSGSTISGISAKWAAAPGGGTGLAFPWPLVQATADGFVVVSTNPSSPGAWFSPDGVSWTSTTSTPDQVSLTHGVSAAGGGGIVTCSALTKWYRAGLKGENWRQVGVAPHLPSTGWLAGDGDRVVIISGGDVDWSADGITWHRGTSTAEIPAASPTDSSIFYPLARGWLLGSLILASSDDRSTLYVGHLEA